MELLLPKPNQFCNKLSFTDQLALETPPTKVEANTWPSKFDAGSALTMMRAIEATAESMKCRHVVTRLSIDLLLLNEQYCIFLSLLHIFRI